MPDPDAEVGGGYVSELSIDETTQPRPVGIPSLEHLRQPIDLAFGPSDAELLPRGARRGIQSSAMITGMAPTASASQGLIEEVPLPREQSTKSGRRPGTNRRPGMFT